MDVMNTADVLYRGWDANLVRERRNGFDAESSSAPTSSGFKAINHQPTQLLTPQSSAVAPVQQNQARRRATSQTKRRRNPTVAQYLGLGSSDEPRHLEKYAPWPDGPRSPPPKPRKRQKVRHGEKVTKHFSEESKTSKRAPSQRRVSEGLRVTKPQHKPTTRSKTAGEQDVNAQIDPTVDAQPGVAANMISLSSEHDGGHHVSQYFVAKRSLLLTDRSVQDAYDDSGDYYPSAQPLEDEWNDIDSDAPNQLGTGRSPVRPSIFDGEDFEDDLNDDELLELTSDLLDIGATTDDHSSSELKPQLDDHPPHGNEQVPSSSTSEPILVQQDKGKRTVKKFVSPTTLTTRLLAATGDIDTAAARKPIARPPFPAAVRDRSPLIGLSANTLLRTCFRIGEVINQAHQASKAGKHIIFELYARVLSSERDDTGQHFTFCDLFHGKPPYLKAVYDASKWKSVQLYDYDSKRLLQQGRIGRCIGTMRRDGKEWIMTVLNCYEATWQDIQWVEGILNP